MMTTRTSSHDTMDHHPVRLVTLSFKRATRDGNEEVYHRFELPRGALKLSKVMRGMIEEAETEEAETGEVPVMNIPVFLEDVSAQAARAVVRFLRKHENDPYIIIEKPIPGNSLKGLTSEWDEAFASGMDMMTIMDVIRVANWMDITELIDLMVCQMACMLKGKSVDDAKQVLNLPADVSLTSEEEQRIRIECKWIFDL